MHSKKHNLNQNWFCSSLGEYHSEVWKYLFRIITPKPISDGEIQLSKIDGQSYTGTLVEPEVVLTWETPLVRNKDFQVIYSNNLNVGTASVTIIGIGNYNGARSTTFNIGTVKVKLTLKLYEQGELVSGDTYTYDGTPKMPTAKVFRGTKELDEGKDFVVNYLNNVNVGTARVTTEFRGNYSGRLVGEFIINKFYIH